MLLISQIIYLSVQCIGLSGNVISLFAVCGSMKHLKIHCFDLLESGDYI